MRLFQRQPQQQRQGNDETLSLPLEGAKSVLQQQQPSSQPLLELSRERVRKFFFSTTTSLSPRSKAGKKNGGGRGKAQETTQPPSPSEELTKVVQERRLHLTQKYQLLRAKQNAIAMPTTKNEPQQQQQQQQQQLAEKKETIRKEMALCKKEILALDEHYQVMLFRFATSNLAVYDNIGLSLPPMNPDLGVYENNPQFLRNNNNQDGNNGKSIHPTPIANYTVRERIGEGSYGSVWRVSTTTATTATSSTTTTKTKRNGLFAMKVVPKAALDRWHKIEQLDNEIQALQNFGHHPNILGLREVLHGPANVYLVTELAWTDVHAFFGPSYSRNNKNHHNRSACVQQIAIGVLQALQFLHDQAMCAHLDIKPENILLVASSTDEGDMSGPVVKASNVRLCDFGFCSPLLPKRNIVRPAHRGDGSKYSLQERREDDTVVQDSKTSRANTTASTRHQHLNTMHATADMFGNGAQQEEDVVIKGTMGFMAPELLCRTRPWDGRRADMWSLGATLLDLILPDGLPEEWMLCYARAMDARVTALEEGFVLPDSVSGNLMKSLQKKLRSLSANDHHQHHKNIGHTGSSTSRSSSSSDVEDENFVNWIYSGLLVSAEHRLTASRSLRQSFCNTASYDDETRGYKVGDIC